MPRRMLQNFLENLKSGYLIEQADHFTIPGDAMKHFDDAVIRERRICLKSGQKLAIGLGNFLMEKSESNNTININKRK